MPTFTELGMDFPLFKADVAEAAEYEGRKQCCFCDSHEDHTFSGNNGPVCYTCLRNRCARFNKNTVIGSLRDDSHLDAIGVKESQIRGYGFANLGPHPLAPSKPDWHLVATDPGLLTELSITPNFNCWSDCTWIFCCQRPMTYLGIWKVPQFLANANGVAIELFFNSVMIDEWDRVPNPDLNAVWEKDALDPCGGPYVFQCQSCDTFKANNDNP